MWFDPYDIGDNRVKDCALNVLVYSSDIAKAPECEGLYILLSLDYHVRFIGRADSRGLRAELEDRARTAAAEDIHWYLWVRTGNRKEARSLMSDWIRKYNPTRNFWTCSGPGSKDRERGNVLSFPTAALKRTVF